jgi:putative PIN family toxin of toxin-antitoxin system
VHKVVIDTNVIVSAALSPKGTPAKMLDHIAANRDTIQIFYCPDILVEYRDVLSREHLHISLEVQTSIINAIVDAGILIEPITSDISLIDEDDRYFFDTAKASGAILITGNMKHFPAETFVMSPLEFFTMISSE